MARVEITYPGETVVDEITALVAQPTVPANAQPPSIGLVEISEVQPTQLIPGPIGPQGPRGSRWYTGNGAPSGTSGFVIGDMYLDNVTDEVWTFDATTPWVDTGTNIHGSPDTGTDILAKLAPVDGAGSGLDADLLDGQHGTYYLAWANLTGVPPTFPPTLPIAQSGVTNLVSDLALKAPLASPALTGTPTAPTAAPGTNTTQLATTAFVAALGALKADLASPTFTGDPKAPTPSPGDNDTSIATTAFVVTYTYDKATLDTRYINTAGDTMTGMLTLSGAPVNPLDAATKAYVDAKPAGAVISDTPPASPSQGQTWWESDSGGFFISYNDGNSTQWVQVNGQSTGNVSGPAAATDNALVRFDLATGKLVQNSGAILDDSNNLTGIGSITGSGGLTFNSGSISGGSLNTGGNASISGQVNCGSVISTATLQAGSGVVQAGSGVPLILANVTSGTIYIRPAGYANSSGEWQFSNGNHFSNIYGDWSGNVWMAKAAAGGNAIMGGEPGSPCSWYIRPIWNVGNGLTLDTSSNLTVTGQITSNNQINFAGTLQSSGGAILGTTGASGIWLRPAGAGVTTAQYVIGTAGSGVWSHDSQAKPTAGGFVSSSDARIKNVQRDYTTGLDAINALRPVVFTFKGNDTNHPPGDDPAEAFMGEEMLAEVRKAKAGIDFSTAPYPDSVHFALAVKGTERIGFVAQEIEQVLPETVTQRPAYIDGQPVDDLRDFDPTNIIYALVNAVKELSARVAALEASRGV